MPRCLAAFKDTLELHHHRGSVVMGHDVLGADIDEIPGMNRRRLVPISGGGCDMIRGDFFDEGLGHGGIVFTNVRTARFRHLAGAGMNEPRARASGSITRPWMREPNGPGACASGSY